MKKILLLSFCIILAYQPSSGKPVGELLRRDGTIDFSTGFSGSLDLSGYRMENDENGIPRFVPDLAGQSDPSLSASPDLVSSRISDNEFWDNRFGGMSIRSLAVMDNNLYVGGSFTIAGESLINNVAKWDGERWIALGSGITGGDYTSVHALAVMGNTLYAGGSFSRAGTLQVDNIAKWDGEKWSALGWGISGRVHALAVHGDTLYAGGGFSIAGLIPANNIAKWDGERWVALGSGCRFGTVQALAVMGDKLYAGGAFDTAGSTRINYIARWDGDDWAALGEGIKWESWFSRGVSALAVIGSDLYVGGDFSTAGGLKVNNVAKWDGENWSALEEGMNYFVEELAVIGSDLYASGRFTTTGGLEVNRIAKWDGENWSALGSGIEGGAYPHVSALAAIDNDLYAGGMFTSAGGTPVKSFAKWDGENWSALEALGLGMDYSVRILAASGNDIYAGGHFRSAGGTGANRIAKWDGQSWSALGSGIDGGFEPIVHSLAVMGDKLFAAGDFSGAGGTNASNIAQWDGQSWSAVGDGIDNANYITVVYSLAVMGDKLFAGGNFLSSGGKEVNRIAKWDGESWSPLGEGMNGGVIALAVMEGDLYAGGDFTTAGGVTANRVAKWDGESWSALGSGMNSAVYALAAIENELYAGGWFTSTGDVTANRVAKWDGKSWSALGEGTNHAVRTLAVMGDNLYAGGEFSTAGGVEVNGIARWDGENWSALGSGMMDEEGGTVSSIVFTGNNLYAGGFFNKAGGNSSWHIARWFKPVAAAAVTRTFMAPQLTPLSFNEPDDVTGVSIRIKNGNGGPTMHVMRYEDAPKETDGMAEYISRYRWIIQQSGLAHPFEAEVRFKISEIPGFGDSDAETAIIYRRTTPGRGPFQAVNSSYEDDTGELVVNGITSFGEFAFGNVAVSAEDQKDGFEVPDENQLSQNYPNPFNPATTIGFSMPQPGMVTLTVYNMLGQKVATLASGELMAGSHSYYWDATGLASGVYIARMQAGGQSFTRRMMFVK